MYGALAGLLIGLIIAAVVAFYVTKAPMPFVDRTAHTSSQTTQADPAQLPDPNVGLYGRDGAAGTPPAGPTVTAPTPLPNLQPSVPTPSHSTPTPASKPPSDELGALIATLPPASESKPAPAAPTRSAAPAATAANGSYFLQAGAFQGAADAEAVKARILLLGLPAAIQRAEVHGKQINRVRVGPFARLDDMNRARSRLGESKIETAVVRQ